MQKNVLNSVKRFICAITVLTMLSATVFSPVDAASKFKTYEKTTTSSGAIKAKGYNYSKAVPQNGKQSASYFNSAAFFGDSRTVDLYIYSSLKETKAKPYCDVGLNVSTALTKKFVNYSGKKVTALYALKKNKKSIKSVYLMFGLNELGWGVSGFIKAYKKLINEIRAIVPNAVIYVQSILPVTKSRDRSDDVHNNKRIKKFNKELKKMCNTKRVFYIDAYNIMTNSKGYLPESAASDGIHFNSSCCEKWLTYLKKRTVVIKEKAKK